jgi:hypothetical protein
MLDSTPHHRIPGRPTFLSLPNPIRKKVYSYLLKLLEPIYIFQDRGCPISSFTRNRDRLHEQTIHIEACETLYGENKFVIEEVRTPKYLSRVFEALLDCIGPFNAGFLRDVTVPFPGVERGADREFRLKEEGVQWLQRVRGGCTGLVRIELLVYGPGTSDFMQADMEVHGSVREVFLRWMGN